MANPYYPPRDPRSASHQQSSSNPFARQSDQQGSGASGYAYGAPQGANGSHAYPPIQNQRPSPSHQGQSGQSPTAGRSPYGQQYADPFATMNGTAAPTNPYYAQPQPYHGGESALHLAPPAPAFASGTARGPSGELIQRPDSPFDGVYEDRPPNIDKLNPAQKKIAAQFPEDLDKEGTSMLQSMKDMLKNWRKFVKWKYTHYYIILVVVLALVALMTIYHRQIIDWLTPLSKKIRSVSWGWVIPVAILFVVSFPPLAGAEIVIILLGVVYGLWIGFAIASLGTLLGELANFYAFKYCLRRTAEKYERKNLNYACMAHIVREGGFMVILLARLSAIPGHFTTAVFATVGMNVFIFVAAALLSMPKQLSVVYLGVAIEQSGTGGESPTSKIIKYVVLIISFIVTIWAAWYLYDKMEKARPIVQSRLRARRYTMLSEARAYSEHAVGGEAKSPGSDKDMDGGYMGEEDDDASYTKYRGGDAAMPMRKLGQGGAGNGLPSGGGGGRPWGRWSGNGTQEDEEAMREGQSILRRAAPLGADQRTKSVESFESSDQSHTEHDRHVPTLQVQHYEEASDASFNPGRGLPRRDVTELDIDVLQSAVAPRASQILPSPQQQAPPPLQHSAYSGPPPQYQSPTAYHSSRSPPAVHNQAHPQARQGSRPPPVANSNNRRSYRYATDVGSIYDIPGSTSGGDPESAAQMYLGSSASPPQRNARLEEEHFVPPSHAMPTRWSQVDGPSAV